MKKQSEASWAHRAEAMLVRALLAFLRKLPPRAASNLGGNITKAIGPYLPVSHVADMNLRLAMPKLTNRQRQQIVQEVWENLGRTVAEFPHIPSLQKNTPSGPGWLVEGDETLRELAAKGGPVIFFSGHIGNWEMLPPAVASYGMAFASFYRAAGNPLVDRIIGDLRRRAIGVDVPMFAKGAQGARGALRHIAQGGHLGVLGDQKMNDGIEAQLFGHPAMSASATAAFALKHNCPIVAGRIERIGPARLKLIVEPAIIPENTGDRQADILRLTQRLNDQIETWVRAKPGSWLWLHRRWPKELMRSHVEKMH
ncbi:lysophospholipid acyltransferase family protein [Kozakia baliensis]|nr:lauroyl acyltransferase [Kozakia baliensis]GBR29200.1 lipid A biosynthesis lauroyl acyltransferase [Kozakia baliensis NRIC 0488]GEL63422.1 lipid A biosynthesis lauroyl acyltransferase [Kozakia baliensis]